MVKQSALNSNDRTVQITFVEICQQYAIPEALLLELLEYGLITDIPAPNRNLEFSQSHVQRILSACRLHTDLDINTHGVILALELMDELTQVRHELDVLRRHLHGV
jgi:chaperone modulatory protein CbpM